MPKICALILSCPTCQAKPYQRCLQPDPKSFFGEKVLTTGSYHPERLTAARKRVIRERAENTLYKNAL